MSLTNNPEYKQCPILSSKDRTIYCTSRCMAFMSIGETYACKLINKNSKEESWHKR